MLKIKELRKQNNITLQKLANYLHTGTSTISQYETGKREANFDTLCKIADFFNVSVDYLLGREEKSNPEITESPAQKENTIRIIGRGGVIKEYKVTEEQQKAFETLLATLPKDDPDLKF